MAGLPTQAIPIPFSQGVDTKTDPKQVAIGKLLTLENGFFQTPLEIRKRFGYEAFSQTILTAVGSPAETISQANGLMTYSNELLQTNNRELYSYLDSSNKWSDRGIFTTAKLTIQPVSVLNNFNGTVTSSQLTPDGVYDAASGLQVSIWRDSSGKGYFNVTDNISGTIIRAQDVYYSGVTVFHKVVFFSNTFVIFYATAAGLFYKLLSPSDPLNSLSGPNLVTSNISAAFPTFDVAVISARLFIIYNHTATKVAILYLSSTFVGSAEVFNANSTGDNSVCIFGSFIEGVFVGFSGSSCWSAQYDYNLAGPSRQQFNNLGVVNQMTGSLSTDVAGSVYPRWFGCNYTNHSINNVTSSMTWITGGLTVSNSTRSLSIASKTFFYNGDSYILLLYGGPATQFGQPTLFLYRYAGQTPSRVIGKIAPGVAFDAGRTGAPAEITTSSDGVFHVVFTQNAGANEVEIFGSTWALTIDLTVLPQTAQIANTLHITGGQLWMYDGTHIVEHGFHLFPSIISITPTGASVLEPNADYQYIAVYEWLDAQGQLHRSAPSIVGSFTTGGSGAASVDIVVSTLRVTNKLSATSLVMIYLYRTTGNGTVFYSILTPKLNTTAADTVTFTDTKTDAQIISQAQLYTTGGQVENSSAPACLAITTYKSRLIVVPSDNPYSWWYSQEVIPNSASSSATPVELSQFFIQNIDQKGGPLTGISVIDDKLILMKEHAPYYIVGNGPAPNGTNNDYTPPQEIVSPVGSGSKDSIVQTPMGLIFQASNDAGIWLLDRSLNASYIGSDVEAYNSQDVTSGVLYAAYNQVRFSMSGGICLAFDYIVNQWTVSTNIAAIQAALFQGRYTYVRSNGLVLKEDPTVFTDNGTFVQLKIGTSWLKFAGLQGFQRVYEALILGDYETAHSLIAKVYYDFSSTEEQTTTITPTATQPYQWRLLFNRQKCEALKIELYDSQNTPAEGMSLSALSLIVGVKYGLNKMSASRTFE